MVTNWLRLTPIILCVLLSSCYSPYSTWRTHGYSISPDIYRTEQIEDVYHPSLIELRKGLYLWVSTNSVHELNQVEEKCAGFYKELNFSFWSRKPVSFNLNSSNIKLYNEEASTIYFSNPKNINRTFEGFKNEYEVMLEKTEGSVYRNISSNDSTEAFNPSLKEMEFSTWVQIELSSFIPCAENRFEMFLSFTDNKDETFTKTVYFFPVTFTKLDR